MSEQPVSGPVDLLHIDGVFQPDASEESFYAWRSRLTEDAVVLFHGTNGRETAPGPRRLFDELRSNHPSFEFVHGRGLGVVCPGGQVPEALRWLVNGDGVAVASTRSAYGRLGEAAVERQQLRELRAHVEALREGIDALHHPDDGTSPAEPVSVPPALDADPTILHVRKVRAAERELGMSLETTIRELEAGLGEARKGERAAKSEALDLRRRIDLMLGALRGRDRVVDRLSRAEERARRLAKVGDDLRTLMARKRRKDREVDALRSGRDRQSRDLMAVSRRQAATLRRSWAAERQARLDLERRLAAIERSRTWRLLAKVRSIAGRHLPPAAMPLAALGDDDVALLGAVEQTGLFDETFYAEQNPDVALPMHPALHFARLGWREGRRPNADFSPDDYLARHPSVAVQDANPLIHFADHGIEESIAALWSAASGDDEGLPPELTDTERADSEAIRASGSFDLAFYRARNPDVAADGDHPIAHYVRSGWREGRDPSADFETAFYLAQNPDVAAAGINPLLHFIEVGRREGRAPRASMPAAAGEPLPRARLSEEDLAAAEAVADTGLFDADFYRAAYPDALSDGRHPLVDFAVQGWREGRDPSASFDVAFYLERNADVARSGENPLVHYADGGAAEGRHPLAETDPLRQAGTEEERLAQDVLETGVFDEAFYGVHNPDVVERQLDPALHFARWGWKEGRRPHPEFEPRYYLETYPDVAALGVNPLLHYARHGIYEGRRPSAERPVEIPPVESYARWVATYDTLADDDRRAIRERLARLSCQPLISVLMTIHGVGPRALGESIVSLQRQIYEHWELCIVVDASTALRSVAVLRELAGADPRIKLVVREEAGDVCASSNAALGSATGEFVAIMGHDDRLPEHAFFVVAACLDDDPDHDLVYSDEDRIDRDGRRSKPCFKSDYNPELMLGHDLIGNLGLYRRSVLDGIGGFRPGYEGAQAYDVALRFIDAIDRQRILHIPHILYHRRGRPGETIFSQGLLGRGAVPARAAIEDHLVRTGQGGEVVPHPLVPSWHRVVRRRPDPAPLVSVIVPTRDMADVLKACCEGILWRTDYPHIELIVVDHQSTDPATLALLSDLARDDRVRIVRYEGVFNYSAINNAAARHARGSVLALLNNDVEVIGADWLDEMVALACRPDVGAVGAKLLYADGRVQHAGMVVGIDGVARHAFHLLERDDPGVGGRAVLTAAVSAVTGACLVLRKEIFDRVGGFDERNLAIAFNDVDLCLEIRRMGLRNVLAAQAVLHHHESLSRGHDTTPEKAARFRRERAFVQEKWKEELRSDPYYNPNLNAGAADFSPAFPPRRSLPWAKPPIDTGAAEGRTVSAGRGAVESC